MINRPASLDTIVATNLHADILSDLAAALAGSLGIAPTGNIDPERRYPSMFEPIHGSAFDIMGKGLANPVGTFWSVVMLLEHLGEAEAAKRVMQAIEQVTANPALHTRDLGGKATTAAGHAGRVRAARRRRAAQGRLSTRRRTPTQHWRQRMNRPLAASRRRRAAAGRRAAPRSAWLSPAGAPCAQAWPAKPITLIVPFPPGGTTDVLARALADKLSQSLGQPVIVESKPGAGATLGADYVAKAKPDGYTLLVGAVHHTIATSVYKKLPYDFQKDFAPITTIALVPNVLVVNASTPAKNVAELVALARRSRASYTYGSNGNGTAQHLIGTQFQNLHRHRAAARALQGQRPAHDRPARRPGRRCRSTPSRRCCSTSRAASCARWP